MNTPPPLHDIDHIHVFVADRTAAEAWYARVLGLVRVPELGSWAAYGGPLTLGNVQDTIHLALFERAGQPCRSTVAMSVSAAAFVDWQRHLAAELQRPVEAVDHGMSWSLYFADPDGNPYEITCYDVAPLRAVLAAGGG